MLGDQHQRLYRWRGAGDSFEKCEGCADFYLSGSFRFGFNIADAASKVLKASNAVKELEGHHVYSGTVVRFGDEKKEDKGSKSLIDKDDREADR